MLFLENAVFQIFFCLGMEFRIKMKNYPPSKKIKVLPPTKKIKTPSLPCPIVQMKCDRTSVLRSAVGMTHSLRSVL